MYSAMRNSVLKRPWASEQCVLAVSTARQTAGTARCALKTDFTPRHTLIFIYTIILNIETSVIYKFFIIAL
jgi:hypothetical protein